MINTKFDKETIQDLTDRLLDARNSNLKMVLDIEHRLEHTATIQGVEIINDSKSTSMTATHYSLNCMQSPVIWLLSCVAAESDLSALRDIVEEKVSAILYLGQEDSSLVEDFIQQVDVIQCCDTMVELMDEALKLADAGDTILFSPATAVSEQFESYRHRGEEFKRAVQTMID
ncbi:MAG: hypothetical protein HKN79_04520 [Flavobacteriales bacterium]|nr:hypothetical protein [Flavobacteriales bacterium]